MAVATDAITQPTAEDWASFREFYAIAMWLAAQFTATGVKVTFLPRGEPL